MCQTGQKNLSIHISTTMLYGRSNVYQEKAAQAYVSDVLIVLWGHLPLHCPLALHLEEAKRSEVPRVCHGDPASPIPDPTHRGSPSHCFSEKRVDSGARVAAESRLPPHKNTSGMCLLD